MCLAVVVVAGASLFCSAPARAVPVVSLWDDGTLNGWTSANGSWGRWEVPTTGGNPGGYVRFYDLNSTYAADELHAPARYLGDMRPLVGNSRFEWDMLAGRTAAVGLVITLQGSGERAIYRSALPGLTWSHATVDLKQASWTVSQGTWDGLMANVTGMSIMGDVCLGHPGVELALDNFVMVPEPASLVLLACGGLALVRRRT